jgi:hypothetical protein
VKWNIASSVINYVRLELSPVFISKFAVGCLRRECPINTAPTLLDERSRNWGFGSQEVQGLCLSDWHCIYTLLLLLLLLLWLYNPLLDLGRFYGFLTLHTVGRTPRSGDQPVAKILPTHGIKAHRRICLEWGSNPRSHRCSERRRFMPYTSWPL